jgi:hypothetical protein
VSSSARRVLLEVSLALGPLRRARAVALLARDGAQPPDGFDALGVGLERGAQRLLRGFRVAGAGL